METVLLAAGQAARMGRPKLLLPLGGAPLVARALRCALEASSRVILVTGWYADEIEAAIRSCRTAALTIVRNPDPGRGQFSSCQAGVAEVRPGEDFCIALADAPLVRPAHYRLLAPLLAGHEAVRPFCGGKPGHPVLCSAALKPVILAEPVGATMRRVLAERNVLRFDTDDPAWVTDVDTPEDYRLLSVSE